MDPEARIGDLVEGRYRIDRVVGRGGFGVVYEARHLVLEMRVALKVLALPDGLSAAEKLDRASRLLAEARLLSRLRHPNVVAAVDSGILPEDATSTVQPYLVVEWCDGPTLKEWLANDAAPSAARAWAIVGPLAAAIATAHGLGIVHRDLKPSNVMLDRDGGALVPKLIDFGIAKVVEAEPLAGSGDTRTDATYRPYTPAYAAPEQIAGARTGPWTDVHALALLFTELATGAAPYGAGDAGLAAIDPDRPTPTRFGVDVGAFEPVIARALSLRPAERFADGGAFATALADAAAREGLAAIPSIAAPSTAARVDAGVDGSPTPTARDDGTEAPASVTIASQRSLAARPRPTARARGRRIAGFAAALVFAALGAAAIMWPGTTGWLRGAPSRSSPKPVALLTMADLTERIGSVAPVTISTESDAAMLVMYGTGADGAMVSRHRSQVPPSLAGGARARALEHYVRDHTGGDAVVNAWALAFDGDWVVSVRDRDPARAERVLDAIVAGAEVELRRLVHSAAPARPDAGPATRLAELSAEELGARARAAGFIVDASSGGGTVVVQLAVRKGDAQGSIALHRFASADPKEAAAIVAMADLTRQPYATARDGATMIVVHGTADPVITVMALLDGLAATIEARKPK